MAKRLQILELLAQETRAKRIRWEEVGTRTFRGQSDSHHFLIVFKYPLLADDDGSDADIAEVHVPGLTMTFYNGTEGFDRALQILAQGFPDRAANYARFLKSADAAISLLGGLAGERDAVDS